MVVSGANAVLDIISRTTERRDKLERNTIFWRKGLTEAGLIIKEGETPIVPVMLFNAKLSQDFAKALYDEGIYAVGFFFPANLPAEKVNAGPFFPGSINLAMLAILGGSLVGSLFSADAWNNVTFTGSEVINPKRNLPLSLLIYIT